MKNLALIPPKYYKEFIKEKSLVILLWQLVISIVGFMTSFLGIIEKVCKIEVK